MNKPSLKESFKVQQKIQPFFTSGLLRFDSSGENLLASTRDNIRVLSVHDSSEVQIIKDQGENEDEIIDFVTGQQDGENRVFAAYRSGLLKEWAWNVETISLKRTWKSLHSGPMSTLALSETDNGCLLASGASDAIIKVWDVVKQYCTHHLKGCRGVISCIQFKSVSDDNGTRYAAASGDMDNSVNIWNLKESRLIAHLEGHSSRVIGLQFYSHDDKELIISASRDMLAIVWSISDSAAVRKIPLFEPIESFVFLPDGADMTFLKDKTPKGKVFLTGGPKGLVKAWDTSTGSCIFAQTNSILASSKSTGENEDGAELIIQFLLHPVLKQLVVVSFERNIIFYDLNDFSLSKQLIGHIDQVSDVKFLGDEEKHIVVATNSPNIKIFQIETMGCSIVKGHTDIVLSLQVYPSDKKLFASSSKDNTIRLWNFDASDMTVHCRYIASGHSLSVISTAVPFKSTRWLFSGSEDTTLKVWKIPSKHKGEDDGGAIQLSTLETVKAHDKDINGLAVSPNDKFICSCSQDRTAKIWNFESNLKLAGTLKGHRRGIWAAKFSPVDVVVATSSADTTIKIWSLSDFSCIKTLQGHDSSILNFIFVNRGMQIISSSSDGNVKLWTVKTGECTATLDAHSDKIWALEIDESEQLMITGAEDSHIILWKDDTVEKRKEEAEKEEQFMANEQRLMNLIQQQKWTKALKLAIKLDQPYRALNIVKEILLLEDQDKIEILESSLGGLREDQMVQLVKYALKWNTNSKNSEAAQSILRAVLNLLGPDLLLKLPESREIIEGFLSYTKRHMNRINKLSEQITAINFLYSNMKME